MSTPHTVVTPSGLHLHVGGRHRPSENRRTHPHLFKSLRAYGALPPAPDFDNTASSLAAQQDILGNDELGDCTAAGGGHIIDSVTAGAGVPSVITPAQAIAFYSLSTGYVPGQPATDQGGDEVQVCTTWRDKGYDGAGAHAITGWACVDDFDPAFVKSVAWLFPLYFGIELATPWTQITGPGYVWDVGAPPNPQDGHCVVGLGGNSQGILINSWGYIGTMTYAAIAQFCADSAGGNLFAILTQESINAATQLAPSGFDWATLQADLALAGF